MEDRNKTHRWAHKTCMIQKNHNIVDEAWTLSHWCCFSCTFNSGCWCSLNHSDSMCMSLSVPFLTLNKWPVAVSVWRCSILAVLSYTPPTLFVSLNCCLFQTHSLWFWQTRASVGQWAIVVDCLAVVDRMYGPVILQCRKHRQTNTEFNHMNIKCKHRVLENLLIVNAIYEKSFSYNRNNFSQWSRQMDRNKAVFLYFSVINVQLLLLTCIHTCTHIHTHTHTHTNTRVMSKETLRRLDQPKNLINLTFICWFCDRI